MRSLEPLPYHAATVAHLRAAEPELWAWIGSEACQAQMAEMARLELLKAAAPLERPAHAAVYRAAEAAQRALGLEAPLTVHRSTEEGGGLDAALFFVPGELHVVLHGPVQTALTPAELRALFGHELAHHALWSAEGGAYYVADRLLEHSAISDPDEDAYDVSARRYARYTEIYADRGAALASSAEAALGCLAKLEPGAADAPALVERAEAALAGGGGPLPDLLARARALSRWSRGEDPELARVIEGPPVLKRLDLVQQAELTRLTEQLWGSVLAPERLQTERLMAQARALFEGFEPGEADLGAAIAAWGDGLADYWCYLLLDLAAAGSPALERCREVAAGIGLRSRFEALARRELPSIRAEAS